MKRCPYCAEEIQDEALVCRYCGKEVVTQKTLQKYKRGIFVLLVVFGLIFVATLLLTYYAIRVVGMDNSLPMQEQEFFLPIQFLNRIAIIALVIWFSKLIKLRWWLAAIIILMVFTGAWLIYLSALVIAAVVRIKKDEDLIENWSQ